MNRIASLDFNSLMPKGGLGLALGLLIPFYVQTAAAQSTVQISIGNAQLLEGDSANVNLEFNVQRDSGSDIGDNVVIPYTVTPSGINPATPGTDYVAPPANATLRIPAGQAAQTLRVPVRGDTAVEQNETLEVRLTQAAVFGPPEDFRGLPPVTVANGPRSVATGDFNGDGIVDLVTANQNSNNVSVLLGNSIGGYAAARNLSLGTGVTATRAAITGDFNGDGFADILTVNQNSNNVTLLRGNGAGGFAAPVSFAAGGATACTGALSVVSGDFNSDGNPDLAVACLTTNAVTILQGDGAGNFAFAYGYVVSGNTSPISITAGDFNRDGKIDLAVANQSSNNLTILLGTGTGGFTPVDSPGTHFQPSSITVGDFNGDGLLDLATANNGSNDVSILLGDGTGGFAAKLDVPVGTSPRAVAVGDFDGDGVVDLAVPNNGSNNVSILRGNGSGSFTALTPIDVGNGPGAIVASYLDADGNLDLAVANSASNNVSILGGNGAGGFTRQRFSAAANVGNLFLSALAFATADFDGDGAPDLAAALFATSDVRILLGNGLGGFASNSSEYSVGSSPLDIDTGDFNRDGRPDLVVLNADDSNVSILLGDGAGRFGPAANFAIHQNNSNVYAFGQNLIAVGDINGDGNLDLAVEDRDGTTVTILLGNGAGRFTLLSTFGNGRPGSVLLVDVNGDGHLDLVTTVGQSSNNVVVRLGDGAGGFGTAITSSAVGTAGYFTSGDFNGDGRPDLAVTTSSNTVSILLGSGGGRFVAGSSVPVGLDPAFVTAADLDGDGNLDLAVANSHLSQLNNQPPATGFSVSILFGDGSGGFATAATINVPDRFQTSIAVADFDGDGDLDFANLGSLDGTISVVRNQSSQPAVINRGTATGTIIDNDGTDTAPNPFRFTAVTGAALNTRYISNTIIVSGLGSASVRAPLFITGGQYSLGCTSTFVSTPSNVGNGQRICVRQTSSSQYNTTTTATLNIGGIPGDFNVTTIAQPDITPNSFRFTDVTDVESGQLVTSNDIAVSGINTTAPVSVSGGFFGVNAGPCTQTSGNVVSGDAVKVCHISSSSPLTATNTTLTIGANGVLTGVSDTFTSTTRAADTTPDHYRFIDVSDVPLSSVQTSNSVSITGLDAPTPISATGGQYSIGCSEAGFTASPGTIAPGATVCVRMTSSAKYGTEKRVSLSIGGIVDRYSTTTLARGTKPTEFRFFALSNVARSSINASNPVTPSLTAATPISVTDGQYSVGCTQAGLTTSPGTIEPGQTVCVLQRAAPSYSTAKGTELTVGSATARFTTTTIAAPPP